jgi:hypothetical protein
MAESDEVSKESMKKFMPILNDYYPETLRSFYVLGANILYRAMWSIVSFFVSKRTEEKVNLLKESTELTNYINPNNLDKEYEGELEIEQVGRIIPLSKQ